MLAGACHQPVAPLPSSESGGPAAEPAEPPKCPCSIFQHSSQKTEVLSKFAANKNTATFWRQRMHIRAPKRQGHHRTGDASLSAALLKMEEQNKTAASKTEADLWKGDVEIAKENVKLQTNRVSSITPEQGRRVEPSSGDSSYHRVAARCGPFLNRTIPWKTAALERSVCVGGTTTYTTLSCCCCCPGCHTWTPSLPRQDESYLNAAPPVLSKPNKGPSRSGKDHISCTKFNTTSFSANV